MVEDGINLIADVCLEVLIGGSEDVPKAIPLRAVWASLKRTLCLPSLYQLQCGNGETRMFIHQSSCLPAQLLSSVLTSNKE